MVYLFYIEIEGNVVQVHTGSTREPARLSWLGHLDKVDKARISSKEERLSVRQIVMGSNPISSIK